MLTKKSTKPPAVGAPVNEVSRLGLGFTLVPIFDVQNVIYNDLKKPDGSFKIF
jgi:hypothetical protein